MRSPINSLCAALLLFGFQVQLNAQTAASPTSTTGTKMDSGAAIAAALKLRSDLAVSVGKGDTDPGSGIGQLRAAFSPSGLQLNADADFAYGAIDVGQRLIAAGNPAAAEPFFRAAEQTLDQLVTRTPDQQPAIKAQYLRKLSLIRSRYLNNATQAMADIEQAIALQPANKTLQKAHDVLVSTSGTLLQAKPQGHKTS